MKPKFVAMIREEDKDKVNDEKARYRTALREAVGRAITPSQLDLVHADVLSSNSTVLVLEETAADIGRVKPNRVNDWRRRFVNRTPPESVCDAEIDSSEDEPGSGLNAAVRLWKSE